MATGAATLALSCALLLAVPALAKILKGTPGDDKLIGSKNGDKLIGRGGDDILRSAEGGDLVIGNEGADFIKSGQGFDEIRAGKGGDEIHTRDGQPDEIDCGPGEDTVLADEVDEGIFDCENVEVLAPRAAQATTPTSRGAESSPTKRCSSASSGRIREATLRRREFLSRTAAVAGGAALASTLPAADLVAEAARRTAHRKLPSSKDMPIDTFVVLMMENRSFDHFFGWHPDADAKNDFTYPAPGGGFR